MLESCCTRRHTAARRSAILAVALPVAAALVVSCGPLVAQSTSRQRDAGVHAVSVRGGPIERFLGGFLAGVGQRPTQVVAVISEGWNDPKARLSLLEKDGAGWRAKGRPIRVVLGRSGMGWGLGLLPKRYPRRAGDPTKREGDGRSPAGVFVLGPAFGSKPRPPRGTTLLYRVTTDRDYFVDDSSSEQYNTWQRIPRGERNDPAARWRSFERMRRGDGSYGLGVVIGHNQHDRIPGRGRAIFVHLGKLDEPTVGCVAMRRGQMTRLLRWLDAEASPAIVLLPRAVLHR